MDEREARAAAFAWPADCLLAEEPECPAVGVVHPGQEPYQGRLARAVLAEQAVDLADANLEVRAGERRGRAVELPQACRVDGQVGDRVRGGRLAVARDSAPHG